MGVWNLGLQLIGGNIYIYIYLLPKCLGEANTAKMWTKDETRKFLNKMGNQKKGVLCFIFLMVSSTHKVFFLLLLFSKRHYYSYVQIFGLVFLVHLQ